jgi:hypothetical protein
MIRRSNLDRPFDRSYWVEPGKLLAGYFPGSLDALETTGLHRALVASGIRYIMNLMEEDERNLDGEPFDSYIESMEREAAKLGSDIICERVAIRDMDVPTKETMRVILDRIDEAIASGRPVYVHCWGGKGRTGTVVGCWLARHGIATGEEALMRLRELRRVDSHRQSDSPQTRAQCRMVIEWKRGE